MKERKTSSTQETDEMSVAWNTLPWRKLEQHCFRIQKRIYRAKQSGNTRKVEKLQKLLMKSEAARLLAVRRVTQDNQGKKTAGVDGVKSVPAKERFTLAQRIHPKHWKHGKRRDNANNALRKPVRASKRGGGGSRVRGFQKRQGS